MCEALCLRPDKLLLWLGFSCSCSSFDWQHLLTNLFACCTFRAAAASHRIVRCIVLFSIVANDVATFAVAVDVDAGVGVGVGLTRRPHP